MNRKILSLPHRIDENPNVQQNFEKVQNLLGELNERIEELKKGMSSLNDYVLLSDYEDIDVLNKIKSVDGAGSGLDADLLDGKHSTYFMPISYHDKIGCSVYMSADQSIPDSTQTVLAFDSVNFDYGSGWDSVNHKWVAPKAGLIIAIVKITTYTDWSTYGTAYLRIRKNGVAVAQTRPFKYAALVTAILDVNQGDTIDFSVAQNSGASVNIRSNSYRTYANIYMLWHE